MSSSSATLDEITIASSNGLLPSTLPRAKTLEAFNTSTQLKLGPAPVTEKLREQISRTIQDEEADARQKKENGDRMPNGDAEDVDMGQSPSKEPPNGEIKLEPDVNDTSDLVSPTETETNPPVPPIFRIADLKREVESVRDRRKMIRLGPGNDNAAGATVPTILPSVLAFTLFDNAQT